EDVVIAGGSVVAVNDRTGVEEERAEGVHAAADALAVAAARPGSAAVRVVAGDYTGQDRSGGAGIVKNAAPEAVAAIAAARAGAAIRIVRRDGACAERQGSLTSAEAEGGDGRGKDAAPLAVAAIAPGATRAASSALGLIRVYVAVADGE